MSDYEREYTEYRPIDIDSVDIRDDFMFSYIMRDRKICTGLLRYLLPGHDIHRIEYYQIDADGIERPEKPGEQLPPRVEVQKALAAAFNKRGVRLDAYVDDGDTIYNIEMQTALQMALPKRARLYQAHIDINQLQRGQHYDMLRPSYVIFICTFDPFGRGRYVYSYRNVCNETGLELNDGAYKLFFNTAGKEGEVSEELREILRYINDPSAYPTGRAEVPLIGEIEAAVTEARMDDEWRHDYMTYQIHQRDAELRGERRGETRGIAIGEKRGETRGIAIGEKRGETRGIAIGEKRGETRGRLESARKMLKRNYSMDDVIDILELSAEEAAQIRNFSLDK